MGNSQSTPSPCSSPFCKALCFGSQPPKDDDGEWYGSLPKSKRKKSKPSKSSSSSRSVSSMPTLLEESTADDETNGNIESENVESPLAASNFTKDSEKSFVAFSATTAAALAAVDNDKRRSSLAALRDKKAKLKKRMPKTKLTFVNGQFVDMTTDEGRLIAQSVRNPVGSRGGNGGKNGLKGAIVGLDSYVDAEHCGNHSGRDMSSSSISSTSSLKSSKSISNSSLSADGGDIITASITKMKSTSLTKNKLLPKGAISSFMRNSSDCSDNSVSSNNSESASGTTDGSSNNAITSVVALEDGYVLTASKFDRVIKMWRVNPGIGSSTSIEFVRDFVGHTTGITCVATVDKKGRFLSASKDRSVKLWDSRYSCGGTSNNAQDRILLGTFENMDRRSIDAIAITEEGSYVRPTDDVDWAMVAGMTKKAMKEGSGGLQRAAKERQVIGCSCEFAAISGKHKTVKVWSINHLDKNPLEGGNMAEIKFSQDLEHETTVESIEAAPGKGMILTGDRMGVVRLWKCGTNVFLPGKSRFWSCVRTFCWRKKSDSLQKVEEVMKYAITSLAFLKGNTMFVTGSRSGNLRVWKVEGNKKLGETIQKEIIAIMGAHNSSVTVIKKGPHVEKETKDNASVTFSSASEDGKVLSFAIPTSAAQVKGLNNENCKPCCFNVVNHGIANRYFAIDASPPSVYGLSYLATGGKESGRKIADQNVLVSGISCGNICVIKPPSIVPQEPKQDALVKYRKNIEEEAVTLYTIADNAVRNVESRDRKSLMKTYKNCFVGSEFVAYLVNNDYAFSRNDAVDLGRVLASHLSLFQNVSDSDKVFEDGKHFYEFSADFESTKTNMLKKIQTM